MWIGSPSSIRGTATPKKSTGLAVVAARTRKGSRGVNAMSATGKASSAGVSAVPTADTAESSAHAPRIQRVLTRQLARSSRSSPVGARRPRTQLINRAGRFVVEAVSVSMLLIVKKRASWNDLAGQRVSGLRTAGRRREIPPRQRGSTGTRGAGSACGCGRQEDVRVVDGKLLHRAGEGVAAALAQLHHVLAPLALPVLGAQGGDLLTTGDDHEVPICANGRSVSGHLLRKALPPQDAAVAGIQLDDRPPGDP